MRKHHNDQYATTNRSMHTHKKKTSPTPPTPLTGLSTSKHVTAVWLGGNQTKTAAVKLFTNLRGCRFRDCCIDMERRRPFGPPWQGRQRKQQVHHASKNSGRGSATHIHTHPHKALVQNPTALKKKSPTRTTAYQRAPKTDRDVVKRVDWCILYARVRKVTGQSFATTPIHLSTHPRER